jgi:hypothetical protein
VKVVINTCFGGFGLSHAALLKLLDCGHVNSYEPQEYYGRGAWQAWFAEDQHRGWLLVHNGRIISDDHRGEHRDCPRLVAVIEELGAAANGEHADLKVVEIPAGVHWEIDEYDGREHIAERHRTWS